MDHSGAERVEVRVSGSRSSQEQKRSGKWVKLNQALLPLQPLYYYYYYYYY